jgi:hypothetical protein
MELFESVPSGDQTRMRREHYVDDPIVGNTTQSALGYWPHIRPQPVKLQNMSANRFSAAFQGGRLFLPIKPPGVLLAWNYEIEGGLGKLTRGFRQHPRPNSRLRTPHSALRNQLSLLTSTAPRQK